MALQILTGIRHPSQRTEAKDKRRLEAWRDGFDDTLTTFRGRLVPLHGTHLHYNKPREYWLLPAGSWEVIKIKAKLKRPGGRRTKSRPQLLIKRKRRYEPDTTWFERMAKRQAAEMLKPVSQRAGAAAQSSSSSSSRPAVTLYRALDAQLHADRDAGTQHSVDIGQTFFPWPRLPARLQARVLAFAWWGDIPRKPVLRLEWLEDRNRFQARPLHRDHHQTTARRRSLYHPSPSAETTTTTTPLPTLLTVNRAFSARVLHAFHSLATLHFAAAADLVRFLETRRSAADLGRLAHLVLATTDRDAFEALTPGRAFGKVVVVGGSSSMRRRRRGRGRGLGMLREGEVEEEEEEEGVEGVEEWGDSDSDSSGDSNSSSCDVEDDYSRTDTGSSFFAESESSGHNRRRRRGGRQYRQKKKKENKKRRSKSHHHGHHDHEHHGGDCCDHDHEHAHGHEHDDFSIGATTEETQWRPAWLHWPKKPALLTRVNLAEAKKKVKKATMALRLFGRKAKGKDNKKKCSSDHDCRRSHGHHHHHHHEHADHSRSHGNKKNGVEDTVVLPPINLRRRRSLQNGSATQPKDVLTGLKTFVLKIEGEGSGGDHHHHSGGSEGPGRKRHFKWMRVVEERRSERRRPTTTAVPPIASGSGSQHQHQQQQPGSLADDDDDNRGRVVCDLKGEYATRVGVRAVWGADWLVRALRETMVPRTCEVRIEGLLPGDDDDDDDDEGEEALAGVVVDPPGVRPAAGDRSRRLDRFRSGKGKGRAAAADDDVAEEVVRSRGGRWDDRSVEESSGEEEWCSAVSSPRPPVRAAGKRRADAAARRTNGRAEAGRRGRSVPWTDLVLPRDYKKRFLLEVL
ncbi:hypothetical protein SLS58_005076 [Diplodia intermedia]|uniref:Uncharacterized protein n=1 Tax=Diplodia intermedia TaxID=856260 RepID=A0ABR3TS11_9PEZI